VEGREDEGGWEGGGGLGRMKEGAEGQGEK